MVAGLLLTLRRNKTSLQVSCCYFSSYFEGYFGIASPDPDFQNLALPAWVANRGVATLLKYVNRCIWCHSSCIFMNTPVPGNMPCHSRCWRKCKLADALNRMTGLEASP